MFIFVANKRRFTWLPDPDITAYELALCIPILAGLHMGGDFLTKEMDNLPAEARRHWLESDLGKSFLGI